MGLGPFVRTFKRPPYTIQTCILYLSPLSARAWARPATDGPMRASMAREVAAGRRHGARRDGTYVPTATWLRVRPPRTVRGCAHTRAAVGCGSSRRRPTSSSRRGVTPGTQKVSSERRPYVWELGACRVRVCGACLAIARGAMCAARPG
jgi:hypothetical protein